MAVGQWVTFYYRGVVMGGTIVGWDGSIAIVTINGSLYEVTLRDLY